MAHRIVLALALSLCSLPLSTAPARACGGYTVTPAMRHAGAIRQVLRDRLERLPERRLEVIELQIEGDQAIATVELGEREVRRSVVTLRHHDGAWQIVSIA